MSTSLATHGETINISENQSILNVNITNVTKLTSTNFFMWSRKVNALFDGYDLSGHLDGSMTIPPPTITTDGQITTNLAYQLWKRHDRLIYSALIGAISTPQQPLLSAATMASEIWSTLQSTYAKPSRAHFKQLKQQLKYWKKESKTIDEYVQGLITRFEKIVLLGKPLDHEDQIEYVIEGLPEEYKSVVDQIESRDTPPTITKVHERLLNHEVKLQTQVTVTSPAPISANVVVNNQNRNNNYRPNNRNGGNNNRGPHRNSQTWQQLQSFSQPQQGYSPRPEQRQGRGYRGRCQLCGVYGHSAHHCNQLQTYGSSGSANNSTLWQPRANLAAAPYYNPHNWIMDNGATHHLTTNLRNLSLHQPYNGGEEVTIADGSGLSISHTSSTFLPTKTNPLHLCDVLFVPT